MTAHSVPNEERGRLSARRESTNGLLRLGWPHFWLLSSILGGMLALVALTFLAYLSSN